MDNTTLNYSILKYLKDLATTSSNSSLETGVMYLQNFFNLYINDENDKNYATNVSLPSLFESDEKFNEYVKILEGKGYFNGVEAGSSEYLDRLKKAKEKFFSLNKSQDQDPKKKSEELKNKGNAEFKAGSFDAAVQSYTEAIDLYATAIYYCNRAIAYNKLNKHDEAIQDYLKCIELDSKYIKAYDRLGYTYLNQGKANEAIEIFQQGLEIDPLNGDLNKHLQQALSVVEGDMGGMGGNDNAPPQMPNLANLGGLGNMGNLGNMQEMLNNPNLMEGIGGMLNNPEFLQMTMNMMQDPNFQNFVQGMAQNPNLMNMFGGMGGANMGGNNQ